MIVLLALAACNSRVAVGAGIDADVPAPAHYERAVRDATRELRLYEDLTTKLLLRATLLDGAFRAASEAQVAHLLLLEPALRDARLAASNAELAASWVFMLSADSQWREDLRFGFGDDQPWRLRLLAGGQSCAGELAEKVEVTPLIEQLYPHHNGWSTLWQARFAACGQGPLVLQVTGPHGTGELAWDTPVGQR